MAPCPAGHLLPAAALRLQRSLQWPKGGQDSTKPKPISVSTPGKSCWKPPGGFWQFQGHSLLLLPSVPTPAPRQGEVGAAAGIWDVLGSPGGTTGEEQGWSWGCSALANPVLLSGCLKIRLELAQPRHLPQASSRTHTHRQIWQLDAS